MDDDQAKWVKSDSTWKDRLGQGWKGTRFIGQGSYGKVGLWEFEDAKQPEPLIKQIAIKQQEENPFAPEIELEAEGRIMALLTTIRSKHLVRLYGQPKADTENGNKVVRLFMEYCPGGDLTRLMENMWRNTIAPETPLGEADIWAMFYCLALGVAAIDRGTENPNAEAWDRPNAVVHYDINPRNVLLGYKDTDHQRYPVLKIGDFGLAIEEPRTPVPGYEVKDRGDEFYRPPEVTDMNVPLINPFYGTPCNVYQVGCMIHALITRQDKDLKDAFYYQSQANERLRYGFTQGHELERVSSLAKLYSSHLRELVMECMMREPEHRPDSLRLQFRAARGLQVALNALQNVADIARDPYPLVKIPSMSNAWLEDPIIVNVAEEKLRLGAVAAEPLNGPDVPAPAPRRKRNRVDDDDDNEAQQISQRNKRIRDDKYAQYAKYQDSSNVTPPDPRGFANRPPPTFQPPPKPIFQPRPEAPVSRPRPATAAAKTPNHPALPPPITTPPPLPSTPPPAPSQYSPTPAPRKKPVEPKSPPPRNSGILPPSSQKSLSDYESDDDDAGASVPVGDTQTTPKTRPRSGQTNDPQTPPQNPPLNDTTSLGSQASLPDYISDDGGAGSAPSVKSTQTKPQARPRLGLGQEGQHNSPQTPARPPQNYTPQLSSQDSLLDYISDNDSFDTKNTRNPPRAGSRPRPRPVQQEQNDPPQPPAQNPPPRNPQPPSSQDSLPDYESDD